MRLQSAEIKSGQAVTSDYIRAGQKSARFSGDKAAKPWLVYGSNESYERSGVMVMGWRVLVNDGGAHVTTDGAE